MKKDRLRRSFLLCNAQKIKAYTTSVTSYSLMMLNKKTSSGTVSDYVAYFDYDQQKNEEVCSIYKIKKKANKKTLLVQILKL